MSVITILERKINNSIIESNIFTRILSHVLVLKTASYEFTIPSQITIFQFLTITFFQTNSHLPCNFLILREQEYNLLSSLNSKAQLTKLRTGQKHSLQAWTYSRSSPSIPSPCPNAPLQTISISVQCHHSIPQPP